MGRNLEEFAGANPPVETRLASFPSPSTMALPAETRQGASPACLMSKTRASATSVEGCAEGVDQKANRGLSRATARVAEWIDLHDIDADQLTFGGDAGQ